MFPSPAHSRCAAPELEAPVLPHLDQKEERKNYDIKLEVSITPDGALAELQREPQQLQPHVSRGHGK